MGAVENALNFGCAFNDDLSSKLILFLASLHFIFSVRLHESLNFFCKLAVFQRKLFFLVLLVHLPLGNLLRIWLVLLGNLGDLRQDIGGIRLLAFRRDGSSKVLVCEFCLFVKH